MTKDAWKRFSDEGYKHYQVVEAGFKYNMMDIQAAIGIHQLRRVEQNWLRRKEIWSRYGEAFTDLPLGLPAAPEPGTRHAFHLYALIVDTERATLSRDDVLGGLEAHNIGAGVHYLSIPEHPYYQERFGWRPEDFPKAMRIGRQTLSIPLSARLANADVDDVIMAVRSVLVSS
jgi:dTDP-4-amino-4,6-dideoxygalactose transaminase